MLHSLLPSLCSTAQTQTDFLKTVFFDLESQMRCSFCPQELVNYSETCHLLMRDNPMLDSKPSRARIQNVDHSRRAEEKPVSGHCLWFLED